jgi:hypothetical protein
VLRRSKRGVCGSAREKVKRDKLKAKNTTFDEMNDYLAFSQMK